MGTLFPGGLDVLTNPSASSNQNDAGVVHSSQHADVNDAIEAIEAKVGVNNSGVATSLDYMLRSTTGGHNHDGANSRLISVLSATLADAKGDLLAASGADAFARLPVGGNGQVLTADGAQTLGVKWATPAQPGGSVVAETIFGLASAAGSAAAYSRSDHSHGSPTNPVTAHEAASDPHAGYLLESLIDAKGDLLVGSAADTVVRLVAGTDGHVLKANSAVAAGVEWAAESGGGGGAPVGGQYVVLALDGTLTAERRLQVGTDVTLTDGGANGDVTIGLGTNVPRKDAENTFTEANFFNLPATTAGESFGGSLLRTEKTQNISVDNTSEKADAVWIRLVKEASTTAGVLSALHVRCDNGSTTGLSGNIHTLSLHAQFNQDDPHEATPLYAGLIGTGTGQLWGSDFNVRGPTAAQARMILGGSIGIANEHSGTATAGVIGLAIKAYRQGQNLADATTYAGDYGLLIYGLSGNTTGTSRGWNTGIGIGISGLGGDSLSSARVGTGILVRNYDAVGLRVESPYTGTPPAAEFVGKVGVGMTGPSTQLQVRGTGAVSDPLLLVDSTGATDANTLVLQNGTDKIDLFITGGAGQFMSGTAQGDGGIRVGTTRKLMIGDSGAVRLALLSNGNVGFRTSSAFGGGAGVIGIANAGTVPTTNPTDGGVLYAEAGALKWRGSGGTVTTIAAA